MTKITSLRRFLLPCFAPSATTSAATPSKTRLSTSLRDDLPDVTHSATSSPSSHATSPLSTSASHPRASKSMVIGTIFGHRRGHVWFAVQLDRRSSHPLLLLELSIPTHLLVAQMSSGLVRIVLQSDRSDLATCPLRSIPIFTLLLDGRKIGSAARRRPGESVRLMLKAMESITAGAGALPAGLGFGAGSEGPVMYMRANYEHVIGSADAESFHLINPDQLPGQELSVFLLRSRNTAA